MVIQEIIRRLEQGVTRPFLCRGDDGRLYVVKGRGDRDTLSLCREWLAGQLGRGLGLPIPPFVMADVPVVLVENSAVPEIESLGSGSAFASLWVDHAEEFALSNMSEVLADVKPSLLLFDRWIRNGDRSLTARGGNPNLLWTPNNRMLHVIDHNNAFDEPFDAAAFWRSHVFRESSPLWTEAFRAAMIPRLAASLDQLDTFWEQLPEEWLWTDTFQTVATNIDRSLVRAMLEQPQSDPATFWKPIA